MQDSQHGRRREVTLVERRESRRFPVGWPITIRGSDKRGRAFEETAVLENLSSVGAYLYTRLELTVGARLEVSIRLPLTRERWMQYPALIIRIDGQPKSKDAATETVSIGIAMRFEQLKPRFASH